MGNYVKERVYEMYKEYAKSSIGIDGQHFARICREICAELTRRYHIPPVSMTSVDIIFAQQKGHGSRRLNSSQFFAALEALARKISVTMPQVVEALTATHERKLTGRQSVASSRQAVTGPARFYYDRNTYTGVHSVNRVCQIESSDANSHRTIDLSEIVNREKKDRSSVNAIPTSQRSDRRSVPPLPIPRSSMRQSLTGNRVPSSDVSPASTISQYPRRPPHRLLQAPVVAAGKENQLLMTPSNAVFRISTPPRSDEFYKKVISNRFLSPVDGYFQGLLGAQSSK